MPDHPDLVVDLALDRYLDQVLQGDRDGVPPEGVDVGLAETVRRLEALNRAPKAEAQFANLLLEHLIDASNASSNYRLNQPVAQGLLRWGRRSVISHQKESETPMLPSRALDTSQPFARLGRPASLPRPGWSRTRGAPTQLATVVLLVLTILTGLVGFRIWGQGGPQSPLSHLTAPNVQAPAAASPATSPAASAALAEFVAEIPLGTGPSRSPAGLAVDADGTLYVIDALQDHIQLFSPDGQPLATWGETGEALGQFRFHGGGGFWGDLAFGPDGNLYVLDPFNSRVQVLGPDGVVVRAWGEAGSGDGQFAEPVGLALDADGRVYVGDTDNFRMQIFDAHGRFLDAWISSRDGEGLPSSPANVDVDASGIVSVTGWNTNSIIRLDANGTIVETFAGEETAPEQLAGPWGMTSDGHGNLFVADRTGNRIQVFAPDGTLVGTIGSVGVQPGQFISPKYVALGKDGLLYVADEGNRRVQVFRLLAPLGAASAPTP